MPSGGACATLEVIVQTEVMTMPVRYLTLGLSEQELREGLEAELATAMHAEAGAPTIHAVAHAVARVIELDHLRIAEQLEAAGVRLEAPDVG
jgi:hypothetical protein